MAATLTDSGELTYASFPITKTSVNEDGDLEIFGKCSDGELDSDNQVVSPSWMAEAGKRWFATGANLRVNHNAQRDPAGIGLEINTDQNGVTWLKGLVVEPVAQKLVAKGALRAFSVGIARPTIERDVTGKARGGVITDGELVEISLVDRPANARARFQLVKSVDGHAEYIGELFGDSDVIQKALGTDIVKTAEPFENDSSGDMTFTFTPNDLAKLLKTKFIEQHYEELAIKAILDAEAEIYKRDVSAAERKALAARGQALSDGSYPIANSEDLGNAAILARSGHGNVSGAKALIARRARELGVANPLDSDDSKKSEGTLTEAVTPEKVKEAEPVVTKDPAIMAGTGDGDNDADDQPNIPKPKAGAADAAKGSMPKPKGKKTKKLPPWLNKPADGDDGKAAKTDPKTASGAEEPADMTPAPLGDLLEYPAKPHMKAHEAAIMRFKTIGIDTEMGILHDLSCPAFHPEDVAKFHPYADFRTAIDENVWQRKALTAATGKSLSEAMEAQQVWQAVTILKAADPGQLNDFRLDAYKAFRDANPGPTSFPSPGAISPTKYCRPLVTDGHSATSPGHSGPNTTARIPATAPNANSFGRPPLSSGQASPSPSFMKGGDGTVGQYPDQQGVVTQLNYEHIEKDKARRALSMMHDHIMHAFPNACPMVEQDAYRVEQPVPAVQAVKVDTAETGEVLGDVYKTIRKLQKKVASGQMTEEQARTELARKTAQKYAKSLSRQVHKGITSIDEVRKALGLPAEEPVKAEKAEYMTAPEGTTPAGVMELQESLRKISGKNVIVLPPGVREQPVPQPVQNSDVSKSLTPDVMKSMMADILSPMEEKMAALESERDEYRQRWENQDKENQESQRRWDALANQPDPTTVAFAGLALNPVRKNAPAGAVKTAEVSEAVQGMMVRQLERTWRTSEHPAEREAAYSALCRLKGITD